MTEEPRSVDLARAARCAIATLDRDDLMIQAAVKDASDEGTVDRLLSTAFGMLIWYMKEHRSEDAIRQELQPLIFDAERGGN